MTPRNWIRAAVAALGIVLIVHGAMQILAERDADAAPYSVSFPSVGPTVSVPAGPGSAALPRPGPSGS